VKVSTPGANDQARDWQRGEGRLCLIGLLQGPVRVHSGGEVSLKIFGVSGRLVSGLMRGGEMTFGEEEAMLGSHRSRWPTRGHAQAT
jgi:hypothetical protein